MERKFVQKRSQIFVSYSHADSDHLQRLKIHLRPFEREELVEIWSDVKIKAGQRWKSDIKNAIDRAAVAILLISADFLASDFIAENELPPLLAAAQSEGVKILPIILKPCAFTSIGSLSQFQAVNNPSEPMIALEEAQREKYWSELALSIKESIAKIKEQFDNIEDNSEDSIKSFYDDSEMRMEILGEEISNPSIFSDYQVYTYEHIDILSYMPSADVVLQHSTIRDEIIEEAKKKLRKNGWDGDGELKIMWIPPFIGAGAEDSYGIGVWFVKQLNNGTSFIMSPVPLPFSRLLWQNR